MDRLAPFFERFSLSARVFYSGRLCGSSDNHETEEAGHLHVLRQGRLKIIHPKKRPVIVDQPSVIFYPRPSLHRFQARESDGAEIVCAQIWLGAGVANPLVLLRAAMNERLIEGSVLSGLGEGPQQRSKKPPQLRGLNQNHNHDLKAIFKVAATFAFRMPIKLPLLRMFEKNSLSFRQRDSVFRAIKKRHSQFLFQHFDLKRDRRLCEIESFCGLSEVQIIGNCAEDLQSEIFYFGSSCKSLSLNASAEWCLHHIRLDLSAPRPIGPQGKTGPA